jgi:hypothetical protein
MRRFILVALLTLACIHPFDWHKTLTARGGEAWAADCKFTWKAVSGASGYDLEYSADQGTTWTGKKSTGALTPDANGDVAYTYTGVPETGLLLFRISATNATAKATRTEYGAWYNHQWKPIGTPSGGGITNQ